MSLSKEVKQTILQIGSIDQSSTEAHNKTSKKVVDMKLLFHYIECCIESKIIE